MHRRNLLAMAAMAAASGAAAQTARPLQVLSGGALEPAVAAALRLWQGPPVEVTFNTAPRIAARLAAGEAPPLVLAPLAITDPLQAAGRLVAPPLRLGGVGVGVALRDGAPDPAIRDEAGFRAAVLAADAVVFNQASTGLYIDRLLARLGLTEMVAAKSVRFPDGDAVLRRIAGGQGREIAFAAITEIHLFAGKGVTFAGPLPPGLQNTTFYAAAMLDGSAAGFLAFLGQPETIAALKAAGLE